MSRRASYVLRAAVLWTAWVWIVLIRNMVEGHFSWSFKLVHITLAVVSLAFAIATWQITTNSRRFARAVERERNTRPDRMSTSQLAVGAVRLGLRKRVRSSSQGAEAAPPEQAASVPVPSPPADDPTA